MLSPFDIQRNDIAAALTVLVAQERAGGLQDGVGAVLWQLQDNPRALTEAVREYRAHGEVPAQYRDRVNALLGKVAA